jgi:hypothetical protein
MAARGMANRLPEALLLLWAVFLAAAIWAHARVSHQPPLYDASNYFYNAREFWAAVKRGRPFDPFALGYTFRPPGTVLMVAPFGFDADPRPFYFRSVYVPAALLMLAVLVVAYDRSHPRPTRTRVALTAAFFSTLPMLYGFELDPRNPGPTYWGMVDGFLTGVGALTAAAAFRGVSRASFGWLVVGALTSSFCILVKPSGVVLAAALGMGFAFLASARLVTAWRAAAERRRTAIVVASGGLLIVLMDVLVLRAALSSAYLSRDNLAFGRGAIAVMKAELRLPPALAWWAVHTGIGEAFVCWVAFGLMLVITSRTRSRMSSRDPEATLTNTASITAALLLCLGVWFWVVGSGGGAQIRYGMPFLVSALVWTIPAVLRAWSVGSPIAARCLIATMVVAPANLAALLMQADPPLAWQKATGVFVSAGRPFPGEDGMRELVNAPAKAKVVVYSMQLDANDAMLEGLAQQKRLTDPDAAPIEVVRPFDSRRPTTYRLEEILAADYLLVGSPDRGAAPRGHELASMETERALFIAWASQATSADGLDVVLDEPTVRILQVRDRALLRDSLSRLVSAHRWRPVFRDANQLSE